MQFQGYQYLFVRALIPIKDLYPKICRAAFKGERRVAVGPGPPQNKNRIQRFY
jgi:hypothetical protein